MKIELGCTYQDRITNFCGVAIGYVEYLTGCNQVLLSPTVDDSGSIRESHWFDVQRVFLRPGPKIELDNGATPGCDKAAPKR